MKKLLFVFCIISLLYSCSSDNDLLIIDDTKENLYPVNLKAELAKIDIEAAPMRVAVADGEPLFYSLEIYKDNGELYYEYYYDVVNGFINNISYSKDIFKFDGENISAQIYLPEGKYSMALMIIRKDSKHPNRSILPIFGKNFNTDTYGAYLNVDGLYDYHNRGVYFNTQDLTVVASQMEQNTSMVLQPMWSYIDINIKDAQTFETPEGTNAIQFEVNPLYYGFGIKSKLASFKDENLTIIPLDTVRANPIFNLRKIVTQTDPENNTIGAKIIYLKIDGDTTILESRKLEIPQTSLENGYYYNINGNLGSKNSGQSMNISLGEFNKEDVVIEF